MYMRRRDEGRGKGPTHRQTLNLRSVDGVGGTGVSIRSDGEARDT